MDKDEFLECLDMAILTQDLSTVKCPNTYIPKDDLFLYLKRVSTPSDLLVNISTYDLSISINESALENDGFPQGTSALMYLLRINKDSIANALLNWILTEEYISGRCLLGRQDSDGISALMLAAQRGFLTTVKILAPYETCLQTRPKEQIKYSGTRPSSWVSGKTALMFAIEAGNFDIAMILSPYEAGIFSILERHIRNTDRSKLVLIDYLFALDLLENISIDADTNTNIDSLYDALDLDNWMRAAITGNLDTLNKMLPNFLGRTNGLGQTATMIACYKDQADSIRTIIRFCSKRFCDLELNKHDIFGNKTLCYAIIMKSMACITLLSAYDNAYCKSFSPQKIDERNIAFRWGGKGLKSCLEYAQEIGLLEAYPLLSKSLILNG